ILRSRGASRRCVCMSQRLGMTNLLVPSMTLAEGGSLTALERPTETITRSRMRIVMSCWGWAASGLMMVTGVMARSGDCARRSVESAVSAGRKKRERKRERDACGGIGELDAGGEIFVPGLGRPSAAGDGRQNGRRNPRTDPAGVVGHYKSRRKAPASESGRYKGNPKAESLRNSGQTGVTVPQGPRCGLERPQA